MGRSMQELLIFHTLMNQTRDSIVVKEYFRNERGEFIGGKIICASLFKANHYGLTRESIQGMTDFDLMSPLEAEKALQDDILVMTSRNAIEDQRETITHKNGEVVHVSVTKFPWIFPSGEIMGVMCIARNITIREKAKEQAKELVIFIRCRILKPLEFIYPYIKTSNLGDIIKYLIKRIKKKLVSVEIIDQL